MRSEAQETLKVVSEIAKNAGGSVQTIATAMGKVGKAFGKMNKSIVDATKTPMQKLLEDDTISYNFTRRRLEALIHKNKSNGLDRAGYSRTTPYREAFGKMVAEIQWSLDQGYDWSCDYPVGDKHDIHLALCSTRYFLDDGYIVKIDEECSKIPRVKEVDMVRIKIQPNPLHNLVKLIMKSEHKIITVTQCRKLAGDSYYFHEKFAKALKMTPFTKLEFRNDAVGGYFYFIAKPSEANGLTYTGKEHAIDRWQDEQNKLCRKQLIRDYMDIEVKWNEDVHYAIGDIVYFNEITFALCVKVPPRGLKKDDEMYWERRLLIR